MKCMIDLWFDSSLSNIMLYYYVLPFEVRYVHVL